MEKKRRVDEEIEIPGAYQGIYIIPNTVFKEKEYSHWCAKCGMDIGYYATQCSICGDIFDWNKSTRE